MDNIREKLVELLKNSPSLDALDDDGYERGAAHLIANGVTVQEWIPVNERLPEEYKSVLVYFDSGNMAVGYWYDKDECISFWQVWTDDGWVSDADCEPIYWMPLPPAPKGE